MFVPLPVQHGVKAQRGPFTLEPVGLHLPRLAAEPQAFEQTPNRTVAIVGLGEDSMQPTPLKQLRQHRR